MYTLICFTFTSQLWLACLLEKLYRSVTMCLQLQCIFILCRCEHFCEMPTKFDWFIGRLYKIWLIHWRTIQNLIDSLTDYTKFDWFIDGLYKIWLIHWRTIQNLIDSSTDYTKFDWFVDGLYKIWLIHWQTIQNLIDSLTDYTLVWSRATNSLLTYWPFHVDN